MKEQLQIGEMVSKAIDDKMLALKWQDKHAVVMLTTDSVVTIQRRTRAVQGGVEEVRKPLVVKSYKGVGDQLLVLRLFPPDSQVVAESILSPDRSRHRQCVHQVPRHSTDRRAVGSQRVPYSAGRGVLAGNGTGRRTASLNAQSTIVQTDRRPLPCQGWPNFIWQTSTARMCGVHKKKGRKSTTFMCIL